MKTLSGLDATFLYLETPEMPMHVGSLNLYELPEGFKGSFYKAVHAHVAKRMHLAPLFHRKLAFMPLDLGHPIWVEAESVDLDFHMRKVPGAAMTVKQVQDHCAKLHGQLIDRAHPLWEFYVFDNVKNKDGKRVAGFYSKIHHAALDGKGGMALANAVLDFGPVPREVPPPDNARRGRTDLKIGEMIGAVFSNSLAQYAKLARTLPSAAATLGGAVARQSLKGSGTSMRPKVPMTLAPKSVFNTPITSQRVFATATLPFAECRAMAKAVDGSFNDIVLWLCSTALRNFLKEHATLPARPLVAAMPVSLREENNKELNNQASMSLVDLGTHIGHPMKRMAAIMESTAKVKSALLNLKSSLPTDYPGLMAPWVVGGAAKAAFKAYGVGGVAERLPMVANLAISNVPGPQVPLYMAGARMMTFHPLSIVTHGLALNITVQTYAGHVDFGVIADKKAVPKVQALADALLAAFEEARTLYAMRPPEEVAKATKPKTAASKTKPAAPAKTATVKKTKQTTSNGHGNTRAASAKSAVKSTSAGPKRAARAAPGTARA